MLSCFVVRWQSSNLVRSLLISIKAATNFKLNASSIQLIDKLLILDFDSEYYKFLFSIVKDWL